MCPGLRYVHLLSLNGSKFVPFPRDYKHLARRTHTYSYYGDLSSLLSCICIEWAFSFLSVELSRECGDIVRIFRNTQIERREVLIVNSFNLLGGIVV